MSKFFSQAEEQKQSEITNQEKEYALPEKEITDKVIGYFTSGNNVARLNMVERGNLDKEKFAEEVKAYIRNRYTSDDDESTARIYKGFSSFIWGYYIIDKLIADPDISDIKIYDYNRIYFKKLGKRYKADIAFRDREDYERFVERCSLRNHVSLSVNNSTQKWTDWSDEKYILRFTAITKMLASNRMTTIHMRKHPKNKKTMDVLKAEGMLTDEMAVIIKRKQEAGEGFLICGKNGCGKTTFMNAAIEDIPEQLSIFCVQEAEELFSASERDFGAYHIIEGRGEVNISYSLGDMVTMAQTMDADVIILGEIKGEEARQFLAAAHTGAICYASTHAESVEDAYIRLCDYTRRISDMTDEEILYMLKSLKNVIFIKEYKLCEMAECSWNPEKKCLDFTYLYRNGKAVAQ